MFVRATRGATREWIERLVDCEASSKPSARDCSGVACPLALKGEQTEVLSARDGFAINIRAHDPDEARSIVRRAAGMSP